MKLPGRLVRRPLRPNRDSLARFASLQWAALPIVDRRWTVPMSAAALGFGIFVGVAAGPGTEGSQGTTKPPTVEVQAPPTQTTVVPPGSNGGAPKPPPATPDGGHGAPSAPSAPPPSGVPSPPSVSAPPLPPISPTTGVQPPAPSTTTTPQAPEEPATETLTGTVVHVNPNAASYAISDDGDLVAIHSHRPPELGASVEVEAAALPNGTYSEVGNRDERGSKGQVSLSGTVSFGDTRSGAYTVSGPGVSLLVRGAPGHRPPAIGSRVDVQARIATGAEQLPSAAPGAHGCGEPPPAPRLPDTALEQVSVSVTDAGRAASTPVEGIVEGVCRQDRKLIVSADDLRESGRDITLAVPESIRIGALKTGQVLKLSAAIRDNGGFELSGVAGDQGGHGANDADLVQP